MPAWTDATQMLSDCFRNGTESVRMGVSPRAYQQLRAEGRGVLRGDMDHNPIEYRHPQGSVLIYADEAAAVQHEEVLTNLTWHWGEPRETTIHDVLQPGDIIRTEDTGEAWRP